MGPKEHFQSIVFEASFKNFNFLGVLVKFPRQHRKKHFRVDKTAKNVWRKKLRKILFQGEKTYYFNFFKILREVFLPLAKNYRHGCQNCNLSTFRKVWGKLVFFKMNMFANIFGLPDEKNRAFSQKVFFRVFNRKSRFRRNVLKKKDFSFEKVFFPLSFLEFEWFLWLFSKL